MKINSLSLQFFSVLLLFLSMGCNKLKPSTNSPSPPSISSSSGVITETDLGVPLYPNSTPDNNQSFTFQGNSKSTASMKTVSASLNTPDSVGQVKRFYHDKLGKDARISEHPSGNGTLVDISFIYQKRNVRIQVVPQASGKGSTIVILTQLHA